MGTLRDSRRNNGRHTCTDTKHWNGRGKSGKSQIHTDFSGIFPSAFAGVMGTLRDSRRNIGSSTSIAQTPEWEGKSRKIPNSH